MKTKLYSLLSLVLMIGVVGLMHETARSQQTQSATPVQQTATMNNAATAAAHSHTSAATITITVPAGNYAYITGLDISDCATGTAVTAAAPTYVTTTNITGAPQYQIGSGVTAGLCQPTASLAFSQPIKSAVPGTNVTFVLPTFATNQVDSVNVYYYLAP
jgi:hypothetical protein